MKLSGLGLLLMLGLVACSTITAHYTPTVTMTLSPQQGSAPLVTLASARANDPNRGTLSYVWRVNGEIVAERGNTLTYTFAETGNHTISVTVSDGKSSTYSEQSVSVATTPAAAVNTSGSADFRVNQQGRNVTFNALNATENTTFAWDFGDGTVYRERGQRGANISHRYTAVGRYQVTLEVSRAGVTVNSRQTITITDEPRLADVPDIIILGFSGRCGNDDASALACDAPRENRAYLDNFIRPATLPSLQSHLANQGHQVIYRSFVARLSADEPSIFAPPPPGYLEAEAYLQEVYDKWIRGQDNPPRLIVLGHSHGAVWMNLLLFNHPQITFDYAISLDGICTLWWNDHTHAINNYYRQSGRSLPRMLEQGSVCNSITLANGNHYDLEDVIPDNVRINLEVQASPMSFLNDDQLNIRRDGSRRGIYSMTADQAHTGSNGVHQSDGAAMRWVTDHIDMLGFANED